MMFARVTGPAEKLNEFNLRTLSADFYHPENAAEYMSGSNGYHSASEVCPFDMPIRNIEEIAEMAGVDFSEETVNVFGTDRPVTQAYLKKLTKYITENDFELSDINSFISVIKPVIDINSRHHLELIDREKRLNQKIDKLSHFIELDVNPNEMLSTNFIEVHFGSLPKDSMIKLYMYNNDNKFIFNTYSSDKKYFWGVYCVSKQYAEEAAKIMEALYFDELTLDPNEGSVPEIIEKCKKELAEIEKEQNEISEFLEKNKHELAEAYSVLLDLRRLWDFRKYAVVNDDTFCCIGWIPKKQEKEARRLFESVDETEFTIKDPEKSVTASGITNSSPFEVPIRDIEHLSHHVGFYLSPSVLHNCIGNRRPLTEEYIKKLTRYLGGADINSGSSNSGLNAEIHAHSLKRKELKKREKSLRRKITRLRHFSSLDVDLSELGSVSYSSVHFGRLRNDAANKAQRISDEKGFIFNIYSSDEKNSWCIYVVPKKYEAEIENIFDSLYFREYIIDDTSGMIPDIIAGCEKELENINKEKQKISDFWNAHTDEIIDCYSILQDLQQLWNSKKYFSVKNDKYVYSGSLTGREKKEILALYEAVGGFSEESDEASSSSAGHEKLTPPTRLKNPGIVRPYEYYVNMYGMPGYGSVDITSFVAVTYTILFGIMFGDLGQGFVLAVGGFLAWKLKKIELGKILVPCGISSMFFGLMFGSVFGFEELLDPLYHAVGMKGKPLSVMESINTVLLFAIGIGIALVAVSILINIYTNIRSKKYGAALFDNNGLAGLLLYLCGVNLVYQFMSGTSLLPGIVCAVVMPICAVILFMKEILIGIVDKHDNWKPDSIADFLMQNIFEMLEYVLSYFSNTVSFLRVGAFVLVHAGMMMVVFSLAGENENIFVIILGNILVICLEGLLTGIQALRLEFYEMFSRCFEGDGKPFISAKSILADTNTK